MKGSVQYTTEERERNSYIRRIFVKESVKRFHYLQTKEKKMKVKEEDSDSLVMRTLKKFQWISLRVNSPNEFLNVRMNPD